GVLGVVIGVVLLAEFLGGGEQVLLAGALRPRRSGQGGRRHAQEGGNDQQSAHDDPPTDPPTAAASGPGSVCHGPARRAYRVTATALHIFHPLVTERWLSLISMVAGRPSPAPHSTTPLRPFRLVCQTGEYAVALWG